MRTLEEKLAIINETAAPGASVAAVARKYGMNANLLFGWRRLQQSGLLESKRHAKAPALLPVKLSTPTLTPTERAGHSQAVQGSGMPERVTQRSSSCVEIELSGKLRVRIYGDAQRAIVSGLLELLSKR